MRQFALTLTAQVKENDLEPLRQVLKNREAVLLRALGGIGAIHFARWVIIEPGARHKAVLAFESNFDGPTGTPVNDVIRGHIDDLAGDTRPPAGRHLRPLRGLHPRRQAVLLVQDPAPRRLPSTKAPRAARSRPLTRSEPCASASSVPRRPEVGRA